MTQIVAVQFREKKILFQFFPLLGWIANEKSFFFVACK
jgi:hypothetical protein